MATAPEDTSQDRERPGYSIQRTTSGIAQTRYSRNGRQIHFNPGHLKRELDRGEQASFGLIELTPDTIELRIHDRNGALRESQTFKRKELG